MTHDEMIAVIQAHKDGKEIQYRHKSGGEWRKSENAGFLDWNFQVAEYRVKPELREWTKVVCQRYSLSRLVDRTCGCCKEGRFCEVIKVREMLE